MVVILKYLASWNIFVIVPRRANFENIVNFYIVNF